MLSITKPGWGITSRTQHHRHVTSASRDLDEKSYQELSITSASQDWESYREPNMTLDQKAQHHETWMMCSSRAQHHDSNDDSHTTQVACCAILIDGGTSQEMECGRFHGDRPPKVRHLPKLLRIQHLHTHALHPGRSLVRLWSLTQAQAHCF